LDVDPTNDQVAPSRHVTVAWGRDYRDVVPLRGVVVGPAARQQLEVAVDVVRL
jgi:transglutaminase-like putative cysteine protease